jgi:hypothetical protein
MEDLERKLLSIPVNRQEGPGITSAADLTIDIVSIREGLAYEL